MKIECDACGGYGGIDGGRGESFSCTACNGEGVVDHDIKEIREKLFLTWMEWIRDIPFPVSKENTRKVEYHIATLSDDEVRKELSDMETSNEIFNRRKE